MKKLLLITLFAFTGAFAQDKMKFSAKVQNRNSDSLTIRSRKFTKVMVSDAKGNFKDEFAVEPGLYQLFDGAEVATVYLKNGFDLAMSLDAKMFDESISYKGKGEKENNFIAKKYLMEEEMQDEFMAAPDPEALIKVADDVAKKLEPMLADKGLDENFRVLMREQMAAEKAEIKEYAEHVAKLKELQGKPSPSFAYENHKGGITKLEDLKGKYVYIDVWATWCGPCRQEIPHLQKVEKDYHGRKIEFVSLSIDEKKDYEKWRKMVTDKSLGGIQLIADKNWSSDFTMAYSVNSIPRFILIDPKGNIVDADAPRPSDPALRAKLDELLK
ncbi:TlpA family protein disulfide reductase [Flavobacterium sp. MFBS3-15]|uniref:TlpA family protein disulfide reductase n=1 Tax=Flavobacterium sp. MFBS3-15 TaxID=2989816 RepID=UPI0022365812|nr:TlpA disulfide reductase family protein [Flavobacterium sp. MFBS3-15]MCW4469730.1 TlpA family protein disulfide reductase [Flavobacterium sp. MFBS3-15]